MVLLEPNVAEAPEPSRAPSAVRRRLAVAALVVAAALGGLGVGMAWASDGDEPARPPAPADTPPPGCGGTAAETRVL